MLSALESFLSPDFWSGQIAAAFKAWAILLGLGLVFWIALIVKLAKTKKEMRKLKVYTDAIESRLQLARDLNSGDINRLAALLAEIDGLRQLINASNGSKRKPRLVEATLKELDASAATLAMATSATDHIHTAETLAIGGLEKKQRLRLVPRPSDGPNKRSR
jgi:hypothetical protein